MKKLLSLLIVLSLVGFTNAQTFINEDFSGGEMPPDGWSQLPLTTGWDLSQTSHAGGNVPEGVFEGFNYTGTARLIGPSVNMNSTDTAAIVFKHSYLMNSGGVTIGIATRNGGDWVTVWEQTPGENIDAEEVSILLTGDQITGSYFQISFFIEGNLNWVNKWYLDDIQFFAPLAFDAKLSSIDIPSVIYNPAPVVANIMNIGNTVVDEVNVSWVSYGGIVRDSTYSNLNLGFAEVATLDLGGTWASPLGSHDLEMYINSVNGGSDMDQSNDTLIKTIEYQSVSFPVMPLFEEFTSSTCAPCASFNAQFVPWCNTHADEIILLKYQMNWPGSGDPYYTAEGGTRRSFYGINAVPDLIGMGTNINTSTSAAQAILDQAQNMSTTFDIASSFTMSGTTINVTTNIISFANTSSMKVHNVVIEKITTENASTNGETEFEHVMMKMFPNGNGTSQSFTSGVPVQFTYSYDMSTTNVEEFDDLMLVVFIQDPSTKQVYQAAYGLEDLDYSNEARLSEVTLDGIPMEDFDPDVYEYDVKLPEGTIEEPVLGSVAMDENATRITNMAFAIPGTASVDVYAEDLFTKKTYKFHYYIEYVGEDELIDASMVKVYPNPAKDELILKGFSNANLTVVSSSGQIVVQKSSFNGGRIDISNLNPGVYFVNIRLENNQVVYKKVVVM
ncbi:MAG: hypothetical protein C0598_05760 [Marinilabiliales bacterium]|nr:MAG: hypothetical protein C0598_05760 [Marinilabiliales bacterium]